VNAPTIVTESNLADGTSQTVVGGPKERAVSTSKTGNRTQQYEGRPSQNEGNVPEALHRLADKLNEIEGHRKWKEHVGGEHVSIDGTLKSLDGSSEIRCQVTRVERDTLKERGKTGRATSHHDDDVLAEKLVAAFELKLDSADPDMFLLLDANNAPAYTDKRVIKTVQRIMGESGYGGEWAQVWLIGPTLQMTRRIDTP
jgi:hypothetical protein